MSMLYLISPIRSEFSILLHKISHQLVMEDHHVKASIEKENHHHDHHDHNFLAADHKINSEGHHEKNKLEVHTHELISFFNSVFVNNASNESTEKLNSENKIDKHIPSYKLEISRSALVYKDKCLWGYYSKAESLAHEVKIPPPRINHS